MLKTFKKTVAALAAVATLAIAAPANAAVPESSDPIKIAINEWTGQNLSAHILGELLKKVGYNVEYVTAGAVPQFSALAQGTLHMQPEVWDNNVGDIFPKAVDSGDIKIVGPLGLEPREGWIYPPYMEAKCPGLPDYKALYDCAQAFATAETFPNGRLITYPADWGTRSKDLVDMIDIPLTPVAGGSEGAMVAELKSAVSAEQPILMMFWQPHWLFADLDFNWVEWAGNGSCDEGSQTKDSACGFAQANVSKIIGKGVDDKWPGAVKFLNDFTLDNDTQNRLILEVDNKKRPIDEVVNEWIAENESTWKGWVDAAKM